MPSVTMATPEIDGQDPVHRLGMGQQGDHDQKARRDQAGAQIDHYRLVSPDQADDMPQRHFQGPRDARPEAQGRQKLRREPQVVLHEEGPDDAGEPRDSRREIDHQRQADRRPRIPAQA